jgi:hypothetical protein
LADIRPKHLCVEDHDHLGAITNLMKQYVEWPNDPSRWPVYVEVMGGVSNILKRSSLSASLKTPGLQAFGIVVDANDSFKSRWESIRDFSKLHFGKVPARLPSKGLIGNVTLDVGNASGSMAVEKETRHEISS